MSITESALRQIIREFLELDEGIFAGVGTSTTSTTMSSAEATAARRASSLAAQQSAVAAKKSMGSAISSVKRDVDKMDVPALQKTMDSFKFNDTKKDPLADERAVAATLKLAAGRKVPPAEINKTVQKNKSLSAALTSVKGGAELEKAAEEELKSRGKNPAKDSTYAWQTVGDIARRQGLAE